ncbi:MAG: 5-oxoprolinase subunit PxpB [Flavisolibacter sp.]
MPQALNYTLRPLGDSALLINYGNIIDESINRQVMKLFHALQHSAHPAITNLVPAYASLAVFYDMMKVHAAAGEKQSVFTGEVKRILEQAAASVDEPETTVKEIPVCYSGEFAPDIAIISEAKCISKEEIIRRHTSKIYRVYMIGFLPGFAYMGEVDEEIAMERKLTPRQSVPAGAVGIAGKQTGIYPLASPGGWQIIGRTPVKIFDAENRDSVFFQPGDRVKFYPISEHEFENY